METPVLESCEGTLLKWKSPSEPKQNQTAIGRTRSSFSSQSSSSVCLWVCFSPPGVSSCWDVDWKVPTPHPHPHPAYLLNSCLYYGVVGRLTAMLFPGDASRHVQLCASVHLDHSTGLAPVETHQELGHPATRPKQQGRPAAEASRGQQHFSLLIRSPCGISRSLRSLLQTVVLWRGLMTIKWGRQSLGPGPARAFPVFNPLFFFTPFFCSSSFLACFANANQPIASIFPVSDSSAAEHFINSH